MELKLIDPKFYCNYTIFLKEIDFQHAEYVLSLRSNNKFNKYISKTKNNIESQYKFIENYYYKNQKIRKSYYFIIYNKLKLIPCGTVRIYNIHKESFEWGSWILDHNKSKTSVYETLFLIYQFAFINLLLKKCYFDVRKNNYSVIRIHLKTGAKIIKEDNQNYFFHISKKDALDFINKNRKKIFILDK